MAIVGTVESLWRYPVKSMAGEELEQAFVGFPGIYGDRIYAFRSSANPVGFPYMTGREQHRMLLYRPQFRDPQKAVAPPNLADPDKIEPGLAPMYADPNDLVLDVATPEGDVLAVGDPALIDGLTAGLRDKHVLTLLRSDRAMVDCRPISLISLQTGRQLGEEVGSEIDKRRFRANLYMNLQSGDGFAEDGYAGLTLRIGSKAVISVLERDPRCKMIALDPDTAQQDSQILSKVTRAHEGKAGVYGTALVEGLVSPGDEIELLA